jgi:ATP-binding cassette, subfamily B, bacterial
LSRRSRNSGAPAAAIGDTPRGFAGVFRYSRRAIGLVWTTSRRLTLVLGVVTVLAGLLPAAIAWVGALIIDAVVAAARGYQETGDAAWREVFSLVALEGGLVAALAGCQRALSACQSLLRAQLGQRVNVMILEKALQLELAQFEDSEFYDKLTRARREASSRPLSLVMRTFGLGQNAVSLLSYGVLLAQFSAWAVLVLVLAGLPAFMAEAKFSGDAFRLFRWRSPETRMQMYLETVLAREDHAKEVQLFGLGRGCSIGTGRSSIACTARTAT